MAVAVVQSVSSNSTSITVTSTGAGNTMVVCIMGASGSGTPSVSGVTLGGSSTGWSQAESETGASNEAFSAIWTNSNIAGSQTAVVVSGSNLDVASGYGGILVYEISGLKTSSALDKSNKGTATSNSWSSGATGTLTQSSEIVIGCCNASSTLSGPSSPWTNKTAGNYAIAGYQIVSATTSQTYSGTGSGTTFPYAACVISLEASNTVAVSLPVATVAVAAPLPSMVTGVSIPVSTLAIAAHTVTPFISTVVALPVATVTVAAHSPGIAVGPIGLHVASVTVAAHTVTAVIAVPLGVATVAIAAHSPGISTGPIALHVASVTISAPVPTVVITVPRLVASIAATSGTDPWGNPYPAGVAVFGPDGSYVQLTDGQLQFNAGNGYPAYVLGPGEGILELSSGQTSSGDSPALIDLVSADANEGISAIDLTSADQVQIETLILNGQTISVPQGSPPTVPGAPGSYTSTWGDGIVTALNFLIAALQDAGIVS
jgi:hypothetical protein